MNTCIETWFCVCCPLYIPPTCNVCPLYIPIILVMSVPFIFLSLVLSISVIFLSECFWYRLHYKCTQNQITLLGYKKPVYITAVHKTRLQYMYTQNRIREY